VKGKARGGRPAKLTTEEVLDIREKYDKKTGNTYKALSQEYGVSSTAIMAIIKQKYWKHV
jgi:transposase